MAQDILLFMWCLIENQALYAYDKPQELQKKMGATSAFSSRFVRGAYFFLSQNPDFSFDFTDKALIEAVYQAIFCIFKRFCFPGGPKYTSGRAKSIPFTRMYEYAP